MRAHATASPAASTQGQKSGGGPPRSGLLRLLLAALLLALALPASASALGRSFVETFSSAAQPTFSAAAGLTVDPASGDLLVIDTAAGTLSRFKADGSPAEFSALGSNQITGLSFAGFREVEVAVDDSGTATDGEIYLMLGGPSHVVEIFANNGEPLGQLSGSEEGGFEEVCGVTVGPDASVYVGEFSGGGHVHKYEPTGAVVKNTDNSLNFAVENPCNLAAGAGPSAGSLFVLVPYNGAVEKFNATTGAEDYVLDPGPSTTLSVDPTSGHLFVAQESKVAEFDASGALGATEVSTTILGSQVRGVAFNGTAERLYVAREGSETIEVFGAIPPAQSLTVKKAGSGAGTLQSTPAGISCGPACTEASEEFGEGETVELLATPEPSSKFAGWSTIAGNPGTCTATTSPCQLTLAAALELQAKFDPRPVPSVSAVSPTQGPAGGGTEVQISGSGLAEASRVEFAGTAVLGPFIENTDTTIKVKAPNHAAGSFDVSVTTGGGSSAKTAADKYTYLADPAVFALSPAQGPSAGGNQVVISGANLAAASAVQFGETVVDAPFAENTATTITLEAPAHAAGTVDVRVTTLGGTSLNFAADDYTYQAPAPAPAPLAPLTPPSLTASPPPPGCLVPRLKGQSLAQARSALAKAHCALGAVAKPKQKAGALIVSSSKPGAGAALAAGAKVELRLQAKPNNKKGRK